MFFFRAKHYQYDICYLSRVNQFYIFIHTEAVKSITTMLKAVHELLSSNMVAAKHKLAGIKRDFPSDEAVLEGD